MGALTRREAEETVLRVCEHAGGEFSARAFEAAQGAGAVPPDLAFQDLLGAAEGLVRKGYLDHTAGHIYVRTVDAAWGEPARLVAEFVDGMAKRGSELRTGSDSDLAADERIVVTFGGDGRPLYHDWHPDAHKPGADVQRLAASAITQAVARIMDDARQARCLSLRDVELLLSAWAQDYDPVDPSQTHRYEMLITAIAPAWLLTPAMHAAREGAIGAGSARLDSYGRYAVVLQAASRRGRRPCAAVQRAIVRDLTSAWGPVDRTTVGTQAGEEEAILRHLGDALHAARVRADAIEMLFAGHPDAERVSEYRRICALVREMCGHDEKDFEVEFAQGPPADAEPEMRDLF